MNIDDHLYSIWYENKEGDKWFPDMGDGPPDEDRPDDYVFTHSMLVNMVNEDMRMIIRQKDVDACAHDGQMKPDNGLIDGLKGRTCRKCRGYQSVTTAAAWPLVWEAMGSVHLAVGSSGWDQGLVMAMTRPTEEETALAIEREMYMRANVRRTRDTSLPKTYRLYDAILVSARSCERCWNALLWRYGCGGEKGGDPGYAEESEEWHKAGTKCVFCEHMPSIREGRPGSLAEAAPG